MPASKTDSKRNVDSDADFSESEETYSIDCKDFDVKKLTIPPIDEKRSADAHYHAFPVYQYGKKQDKLTLKTGPIKITKGGIPRLDDKWRKTDAKREFMWLGIDSTQPACQELFDALKQIDEHFDKLITYDSDEKLDNNIDTKTVYFKRDKKEEPLKMLEYAPMVKLSVSAGDAEQKPDQKQYEPYERVKLRFARKYDKDRKEGEPSELTTTLFLGEKEDPEDLKYPTDFEKHLRWNCTAQFVLQFSKFRVKKVAETDKKGRAMPRDCAFDINILQVVITEEAPRSGASNADKYRKRMFPIGKTIKQATPVEEKKVTKQESSSESSSEESEDDKPVKNTKQEPKVVKKDAKKKVVSSSESESESDSEDESSEESPKPKAKTSKK